MQSDNRKSKGSQSEEEMARHHGTESRGAMTFVPVGLNMQKFQLSPISCTCRRFYVQICLLLVIVVLVVLIRAISNVRVMFEEYHMASDTDGELVVLPQRFAQSRSAFCLDGSAPGYYIRYGQFPGNTNWIIYLSPGAWCSTPAECYNRSFTALGSSVIAPIFFPFTGILSASEEENPDFYRWNMVNVLYCDGGSFLGNRPEPLIYQGKPLYLRGTQVLAAIIEYLQINTNFGAAEKVILAGSSAGGLAALINVDHLRKKLVSVKSIHALLDGMLFLDSQNIYGKHKMQDTLKDVFHLHKIADAPAIQECTSSLTSSIAYRCMDPLYFYNYLFTPVFLISSLHDSWYINHALAITCPFKKCPPQEIIVIDEYKSATLRALQPVKQSVHDGLFITSCPAHSLLLTKWFSQQAVSVNNSSLQQALSKWYHHQHPVKYIEDRQFSQKIHTCKTVTY
ncbi:pectin acetylesterase 5-like [Pecten maximus]|uniref:pectin acetylesterase 5-like n=1 Tax=Pecten maximus TaxID=6579 RepID=UPI001458B486|nr:pectin acetylesterase 5-like [Pecten maximus]